MPGTHALLEDKNTIIARRCHVISNRDEQPEHGLVANSIQRARKLRAYQARLF